MATRAAIQTTMVRPIETGARYAPGASLGELVLSCPLMFRLRLGEADRVLPAALLAAARGCL
jgi:hypothetical protein